MRLLSISVARLTVLTETAEFNPRNKISIPEFMKAIQERYGFLAVPKTVEELDLSKGISFGLGKINEINITSLILYFAGLVIDTRSTTKDCELVLDDLIQWVQKLVGVNYSPIREPRKFFVSELSFHSEWELDSLNKYFASLAARVSEIVSGYAQQQFNFETLAIMSGPDLTNVKIGPSAFRVDRLAGAPFEENKYFSSAPIPTDDHIHLLEEFEIALGA